MSDVSCGTFEIATNDIPVVVSLVVHGKTGGDVFSCSTDMLVYEGAFEDWYRKWLDETILKLSSGKAKK